MGIFKKEIKFISAVCPKCNGNLQVDSNLGRAFCQYCGAQCIVENAPKQKKKQGRLEIVLDFVERQQAQRKQDALEQERRRIEQEKLAKEERERKAAERKTQRQEWWQRNGKKVALIIGGVFLLGIVLNLLGM